MKRGRRRTVKFYARQVCNKWATEAKKEALMQRLDFFDEIRPAKP
jgi:hypothetical protein